MIGKRVFEIFLEFLLEFIYFMEFILKEKKLIIFLYYFKIVNIFYDVVLNCFIELDIVDVFCMDSIELYNV